MGLDLGYPRTKSCHASWIVPQTCAPQAHPLAVHRAESSCCRVHRLSIDGYRFGAAMLVLASAAAGQGSFLPTSHRMESHTFWTLPRAACGSKGTAAGARRDTELIFSFEENCHSQITLVEQGEKYLTTSVGVPDFSKACWLVLRFSYRRDTLKMAVGDVWLHPPHVGELLDQELRRDDRP